MKQFGLLGEKLSHSLSPQIHSYFGDYSYDLIEKSADELSTFFTDCHYDGFNVTIPYKKAVIPYCDELDEQASRIGSVNTIRFLNGKTIGYNTDYYGFRYLLKNNNVSVNNEKVMVLGSGGASLTVQCVLKDLNAKEIVVISRSGENNYENISKHYDANIIINTTPVGMYPDNLQSPIDLKEFKACHTVVDIIYNPLSTKLLLDAKALGIMAVNGLEMLVAQGKRAAEIFLDEENPDNKLNKTVNAIRQEFSNIVLVGMPGCGKSTVGKLLSEQLGKTFADTDALIAEKAGCSIAEIFKNKGEEYFRQLETDTILTASKQLGLVIATGGGAVLKEINQIALKQNSKVVFLKRDIESLSTDGRPLSKDISTLREMYAKRLPIYQSVSDFTVKVDNDPEITCKRIMEAINNENTCN